MFRQLTEEEIELSDKYMDAKEEGNLEEAQRIRKRLLEIEEELNPYDL